MTATSFPAFFRGIVLVVDRRVLVVQAFERAASIAKKLDEANDDILADVARARRLATDRVRR